jgi:integrase
VINQIPHTYRKRGVFYFNRTVPNDLGSHYASRRINFSLRTKSVRDARQYASTVSLKLESYWQHLRLQGIVLPGSHLIREQPSEQETGEEVRFSEATELYLRLKGTDKANTFHGAATRACRYLAECCGDKDLGDIKRSDATKLRDFLVAKGLSGSSIVRLFTTFKAVFNFVSSEHGLDLKNPFSGVYMNREDGVKERLPVPTKTIERVQSECVKLDDDIRWVAALVSDTGMRLSEAVGLANTDIVLDHPHPHVVVQPQPWRRLKTQGSKRTIPLAGMALWAARRTVLSANGPYAFPRYIRDGQCLANSASGSINKWLKNHIPKECSIHSFRHSIRDRLRAVECPKDIVDQIGGWSSGSIGEGYGQGYPLEILSKWMTAIALNPGVAVHKNDNGRGSVGSL